MLMKPFNHKIYRKWYEFHRGTTDPDYAAWNTYGRWGVKMCSAWHDYHTFLAYVEEELGSAPGPKHILHRRDTTKDFKPGNLYWTTKKEMGNTRRTNHMVTHKGRCQSVTMWCEELGLKYTCVYSRIRIGWPPKRALELI